MTRAPMRRREFITLFGGAAAASSSAWPRAACAQQQAALPTIGFLTNSSLLPTVQPDTFLQVLSENGYVEGHNVSFFFPAAAPGSYVERAPDLAAELVRRRVAVIFVSGPPGV